MEKQLKKFYYHASDENEKQSFQGEVALRTLKQYDKYCKLFLYGWQVRLLAFKKV